MGACSEILTLSAVRFVDDGLFVCMASRVQDYR